MEKKLFIGAHTSTAGGVQNALYEGQKIGANTVQLFTSNQRQWKGRVLGEKELDIWRTALEQTKLSKLMSHASYLINLGSPTLEAIEKSRNAFKEEIERCLALGITYLNFHPGAAVGSGEQECLDRIVDSLLLFEPLLEKAHLRLLFENTAGQGSAVGWKFEQLNYLVDALKNRMPVGVCVDTCHLFAAGYDIRTPEAWNHTLDQFDQIVGLDHLYAFHVNDSKTALGSRVDRHDELGKGKIGMEAFKFLVTNKRTCHLPMYLETPGGPEWWEKEIIQLKEFAGLQG